MVMGPIEAGMEVSNLALGLMSVMQGRRHGVAGAGGAVIGGKGAMEVIVEALKQIFKAYGIGHYDETEVAKLVFTGLNFEERKYWTALGKELTEGERKTLNLVIYLMERDTETHDVHPKKADGSTDKDKPATKVTKFVGDDPRIKFMKTLCADVKAAGDEGPRAVAEMLRDNEYIGDSSAIKRYQAMLSRVLDECNAFLIRKEVEIDTPVPMNLFTRVMRGGMMGPTLKTPEPLFQESLLTKEGWINTFKRAIGKRT